ncbi:hypothetical protein KG892_02655 [Vermiphilus pyriformis]|nr:MAG: hypothetical protein KG892_02655 [Vermiphilus pyriformis]
MITTIANMSMCVWNWTVSVGCFMHILIPTILIICLVAFERITFFTAVFFAIGAHISAVIVTGTCTLLSVLSAGIEYVPPLWIFELEQFPFFQPMLIVSAAWAGLYYLWFMAMQQLYTVQIAPLMVWSVVAIVSSIIIEWMLLHSICTF